MKRKHSQETGRKSEELLRLAAWAGKMYAYEWDVATNVVVRSPECTNILGSTESMRFDRDQLLERVHPDDRAAFNASVAELSPDRPTSQITYRLLLSSGAFIWLEKSGRAFFDGEGRLQRVIGLVADVTERKQAEEALSGVSRRLIEAQEQERTRIARDLHDDITQRLALMAIELEQLQQAAPDGPVELRTGIDELHQQMLEIAATVQAMSHELHSSKLAYLGIVAAIRSFCREFSERLKVEIDFRSQDVPNTLPWDISLCLFRVLQEALHNAAKHSGVGHFDVQLWGTPEDIHLAVTDFGTGFELEAARKGQGLGLTSMRERLRLVNGELSIDTQPKRGTTVHARVRFSSGGVDLAARPVAETLTGNNRDALANDAASRPAG